MKNVILAEPSTLVLLGLFFTLIFGIVAVLSVVVIILAFLTRKARREAPKAPQSAASTQVAPKNCPKCGASMPPDSPEGLCPRCLIALNLATQTEIPGEPGAAKAPPGPPAPISDVAKLFPQLEILECLGRGGMGAVYKARQPRLDRIVALKILSPEKQGNQKFSDRFEREARALAKLHHPNIVTMYDFGEVEGNFYLLMEFVDGLTLRQLIQTRKLAPPEALTIVPKICEALQYAHEQGIVHRDIKPENILMDKDGRIKIADFGIAKILGDGGSSNLTAEQVIGTPHYMSPEQIEKPQAVDHRADIYSLGVVFYEMLTGELPIGKFPPPSQKVQMDVRLDEIVLRALEKEPERRYQQASEVKTRVETIANSQNISRQKPSSSFNRTLSRFTIPTLTILMLIIIALAIFLNFRSSHLSPSENVAIKSNPTAPESNTVTSSNGPPTLPQAQLPALTTSQAVDLQKIITESQVQLTQRQAQLAQLSAINGKQLRQALPDIAKDSELYRLQQKLDDAQLQLTVMTNRLSPTNPDVLAQNTQIDMINRQINERITGIMMSLKAQIDAQQTTLTNLEKKLLGSSPPPKIDPATGLLESIPDQATNVGTVLQQADDLMEKGQYDESLQLRLWYYDHALESGDSYQHVVRLSSSFINWVELARRYPPAKKALLEIRDNDTKKISSGDGYFDLFQELYSINHFLQQDDATYQLFKSMEQSDPQLAQQCYIIVKGLLVQKGDFETALKYIGNPQASFESISNRFQMNMQTQTRMKTVYADIARHMAETNKRLGLTNPPAFSPPDNAAMMEKEAKDDFVDQVRQLIESLVGTGDKAYAEKIQREALAVLNDPRLETAVADADEKISRQTNVKGAR